MDPVLDYHENPIQINGLPVVYPYPKDVYIGFTDGNGYPNIQEV